MESLEADFVAELQIYIFPGLIPNFDCVFQANIEQLALQFGEAKFGGTINHSRLAGVPA